MAENAPQLWKGCRTLQCAGKEGIVSGLWGAEARGACSCGRGESRGGSGGGGGVVVVVVVVWVVWVLLLLLLHCQWRLPPSSAERSSSALAHA